jgi:lysophospholipase L1-like esterase
MSGTRTLTWRGKLLLAVLSPLVAFGLLEVGLRVFGYAYEPWKAHLEGKTHEELRQRDMYRPDPDLIWTVQPSAILDLPSQGFLRVRTNAHGLRGPELPRGREPGEVRVLCLGDSVTFGICLADGDTWPERMEEALRAAPELKGRPVRVINGAVPGHSTVQAMRLYERHRDLEPDAIVFYHGLPDSHEMEGLPDSMTRLPVEDVRGALAGFWNLRVFQLVQQVVTGIRSRSVEGTRVSRAEFAETVRLLRDDARAGGPQVVFVREPECLSLTIAQMECVLRRAEEAGAEIVIGPKPLLSLFRPFTTGTDFRGVSYRHADGPAIRFFPELDVPVDAITVEGFRTDLEWTRELKENLDGILAGLPEDSLDYDDFFGPRPPTQVFEDNCHLSPLGARLVGRRLARAVIEALAAAGRLR